jgi:hypothetical protein
MVFYLTLDLKHVKKNIEKVKLIFFFIFIFPLREAAPLVGNNTCIKMTSFIVAMTLAL